jgi:polyisoprenoid-binding protein YceI
MNRTTNVRFSCKDQSMTSLFRPLAPAATFAAAVTLAACQPAATEAPPLAGGEWTLDGEASSLSYVSVKAGTTAEANRFEKLSGTVAKDGSATLTIDLASVETGVDIRNERMREIFFDVAKNPAATVTAKLDAAKFQKLGVGESAVVPFTGTLTVKGVKVPIETELQVTRAGPDRVLAVSTAPVIVDAAALKLTEGLAELQKLAGLPSITPAVPVTVSLAFERE